MAGAAAGRRLYRRIGRLARLSALRLTCRRGRVVLLGTAAILLAAAVVPWPKLIDLVGQTPRGSFILAAAALGCLLAAAVMSDRADEVRARSRSRPLAWSWMLLAAVAIAVTVSSTTAWMLSQAAEITPESERAKVRIDAVRTGLVTGGGVGAAVALLLAFRRQHHHELATASTDYDATEKRITDLYTKAVEQLGSDKAAVRLGGLYTLERVAQNNVDHRQTIVNVICAYLRMSSVPSPDARMGPTEDTRPGNDKQPETPLTDEDALSGRTLGARVVATPEMREEREVRLAAQRILTDHLCPQLGQGIDQSSRISSRFWDKIRLNLAGAVLIDFDFSGCHVGYAQFDNAVLSGHCSFEAAVFYDETRFNSTVFPSFANFTDAAFHDVVWFSNAWFHGEPGAGAVGVHDVRYSRREAFNGATFCRTKFYGGAAFRAATFYGDVRYDEAIFSGRTFSGCTFSGAVFRGDVRFSKTTFDGGANFSDEDFRVAFYPAATFCRAARFDGVTFNTKGHIYLTGARVQEVTAPHVWPPGWTVRLNEDGTGTLTQIAQGNTEPPAPVDP